MSASIFVIGSISQPLQLLQRLAKFVHEAERIGDLRRDARKFKSALEAVGGTMRNNKAIGGGEDEYAGETIGAGAYLLHRQVQFERVHARVQRALAKQLQKRGLKCGNRRQKHGLAPDLYVRDRDGRMTHLFEIKVGQDSQSIFTALGQLLVYSVGKEPSPAAVLVTRGLPQSSQFKAAMDTQAIKVLYYSVDERLRIKFHNIDEFLK
jgi:hypothetical protein